MWVGTPFPVDRPCLDERPPFQQLPRQLFQRGRLVPHAEEKTFSGVFPGYFLVFLFVIPNRNESRVIIVIRVSRIQLAPHARRRGEL